MFTSNQSTSWLITFGHATALVVFSTPMSEGQVTRHANDAIAYSGATIVEKLQRFYKSWDPQVQVTAR